jgi:hypothetical protein
VDNCGGGYDVYRKTQYVCDAGASCGVCLTAIPTSECPTNPDIETCDRVAEGELCEGDGECGTEGGLNNCDGYDVYRKQGTVASSAGTYVAPVSRLYRLLLLQQPPLDTVPFIIRLQVTMYHLSVYPSTYLPTYQYLPYYLVPLLHHRLPT